MSALGLLEMAAKIGAMEKDLDKALQQVIVETATYCVREAREGDRHLFARLARAC